MRISKTMPFADVSGIKGGHAVIAYVRSLDVSPSMTPPHRSRNGAAWRSCRKWRCRLPAGWRAKDSEGDIPGVMQADPAARG